MLLYVAVRLFYFLNPKLYVSMPTTIVFYMMCLLCMNLAI